MQRYHGNSNGCVTADKPIWGALRQRCSHAGRQAQRTKSYRACSSGWKNSKIRGVHWRRYNSLVLEPMMRVLAALVSRFCRQALWAQDPKSTTGNQKQANRKCDAYSAGRDEVNKVCHALPSESVLASWMLADGQLALHWATTSRAQPSHCPHWVATPSSNWISSKPMPARA